MSPRRSPSLHDPRTRQEFANKQDRTRIVYELEDNAKEGTEVVLVEDEGAKITRCIRVLGEWQTLEINSIETAIGALEDLTDTILQKLNIAFNTENLGEMRLGFQDQMALNQTTAEAHSLSRPDTPLRTQAERTLSPLERYVLRFVYGENGAIDPDTDELCIRVVPEIAHLSPDFAGDYYRETNLIVMDTDYFDYTENMGSDTTFDQIDRASRQNLNYLTTFVHESTHYWQDQINFQDRFPVYHFTKSDLTNISFQYQDRKDNFFGEDAYFFRGIVNEQFASMLAVWFAIAWQLEYTPANTDGSPRMIDLSGQGVFDGIHDFDRYERINDIPYVDTPTPFDDGNVMIDIPKRLVSEATARDILSDFDEAIRVAEPGCEHEVTLNRRHSLN